MKLSIQSFIWAFVLVALIAVLGMVMFPKPVEVETARVLQGDLVITVQEDGKTRIAEKYTISAPVAGRLARIELESGDPITDANRPVAVILPADPAMLDARSKAQAVARVELAAAAVKRTAANAEQIRVNADLARKKFERVKRLFKSSSVSRDEYDVAKARFQADSQRIRTMRFDEEISRYELEMAQAALRQYNGVTSTGSGKPFEVLAPAGGKVLRVFQESSTVVSVGTPLIEIGDPEKLEIEIDVLSTDAVRIQPGAPLTIDHWGGDLPLRGLVRVIEPAAFTKVSSLGVEEQRVNIIADFDEPAERIARLGDGYRVEADITVQRISGAELIPGSALFRHQRLWHVFVVTDGVARMRPVKIGRQNDTWTQVLSGIDTDDQVILYPGDTVVDGTRVRCLNESNTAGTANGSGGGTATGVRPATP